MRLPTLCGAIFLFAICPSAHAQAIHAERAAMISTCGRLSRQDATLCRRIVDDARVSLNYKRSCLLAMNLLLEGNTWSKVKSLRATTTCAYGLAHAGYPVARVLARLSSR